MKTENPALPHSVLTRSQKKTFPARRITYKGQPLAVRCTVRYDDQCGNGHNTFAVTGEFTTPGESWEKGGGGCIHDEIAAAFPELAPLIKWHLVSSDGPMHYLENTLYHAGDRDYRGLTKGEFRQHTSRGPHQADGVPGVPACEPQAVPDRGQDCAGVLYSREKPAPVTLEWVPYGTTGEGKARDLDAARSCAVWPEATDAELCQPPEALRAALLARLPALMVEFKTAVESLGFTY